MKIEASSIFRTKLNFRMILERMKEVTELRTDMDVCFILGVSRQTVSNYKNDRADCPVSTLIKFCQEHRISVDWLLHGGLYQKVTEEQLAFSKQSLSVRRIEQLLKVEGDEALSEVLEVSVHNVRRYRKQGRCPAEVIYRFSRKQDLSMDFLIYNRIESSAVPLDLKPMVFSGSPQEDRFRGKEFSSVDMSLELELMKSKIQTLETEKQELHKWIASMQETLSWQISQIRKLEIKSQKYDELLEARALE